MKTWKINLGELEYNGEGDLDLSGTVIEGKYNVKNGKVVKVKI